MSVAYDVFLSHAWADGNRPQQIAEAIRKADLRVWFDAAEINDFTSITRAVTEGLAQSKALLAYYSKTYPLRRACQWELTAAFLAAQAEGDPRRRVLVVSPEEKADHIHPIELRDAKFRTAPIDDGPALHELVQSVVKHVAALDGPLADIRPLTAPNWYGMAPVGSSHFVGRLREMWRVHSLLHAGDVPQVSYAAAATGGIGRVSGLGGVASRCWRRSTHCISDQLIRAVCFGCARTATVTPRALWDRSKEKRCAPIKCTRWRSGWASTRRG